MRFDTTIDFGRSLSWWPLTTVLGAHRTAGGRKILAIWGATTAASVGVKIPNRMPPRMIAGMPSAQAAR